MVIKGSAAKRDRERLHPGADVEQERKKEKGDGGGRELGVRETRIGRKEQKQQGKGKKEKRITD